jgi:3-oxoadipate enol-lactonase
MTRADVRDFSCRYEVVGEAGPPVLLVMGFGMTGAAWGPIVERLAPDHRVCWYDVRGLAESTSGRLDRHTLPDLADDAAALLDHLGWDAAHVAGISMGGMIAQHLALRHRARVRSLTLIATHACGRASLPGLTALRYFVEANVTRGEARLRAMRGLLFPPGASVDQHAGFDADVLRSITASSSTAVRLRHLAGILRHDVRRELPRLAGLPTLVLRPDRDILVPPRCSDRIAAGIPGVRLVGFADGGHGLIAQHPDRVSDELRAHIARA